MRYITLIESFYPSLSKGEKRVADYVIKEKEHLVYQTLQEISKNIGVGEATIIRFCHKIGYNGFQDFKLSVAKEQPTIEYDEQKNYVDIITQNLYAAVQDTRQILDTVELEKAVNLIKESKRVFIYGIGTSGNAALDMQSRLLRYGKTSNVVTDTHFQLMTSSVLSSEDVIIAFSLSGYTQDIVESLSRAKENDTKIITISNHGLSPAGEIADVKILTAGKESPMDGGSLSGRVSQLYVIDLICTGYALLDETFSKNIREKVADSIIGKSLEYHVNKKR
ncbi:MAG: MurR/RpiR family transcriptional regulator [Filifactoraceae bacterium]